MEHSTLLYSSVVHRHFLQMVHYSLTICILPSSLITTKSGNFLQKLEITISCAYSTITMSTHMIVVDIFYLLFNVYLPTNLIK